MLPPGRDYDEIYRAFRWQIPAEFNIGVEVCDRWADREPGKLAIVAVGATARRTTSATAGCATLRTGSPTRSRRNGIAPGDRVAILLPQAPEVAAIHIAIYKLGAIALPLAMLFGTEAISYRLQNSGAKALITNAQGLAKVVRGELPDLQLILSVDGPGDGALGLHQTLERASADLHAAHDLGRRSGHDDLHVRHHRPAQGRAARPPRAARSYAGHRDAARFLPAAGRPVLDAGGLGLGRRPARLPAAEPLLRRAGGGAPLRQVRSRRSLRA